MRLKSEEKLADHGQHLDDLARVISQALGGNKEDDQDQPAADVQMIETWGDLVSAWTNVGGAVG